MFRLFALCITAITTFQAVMFSHIFNFYFFYAALFIVTYYLALSLSLLLLFIFLLVVSYLPYIFVNL